MPDQQASVAPAPAAAEVTSDAIQELISKTSGEVAEIFEIEKPEAQKAVDDLVNVVLKGKLVKGDLFKRINQAIAWLDKRLCDQTNAIIHHPDFRKLESAWRGLKYVVDRKPPGQHLQVRFLNINKKEIGDTLERFSAEGGQTAWTQSPLFRQIFRDRFDQPGGNPFGCMVGDYQFDKS